MPTLMNVLTILSEEFFAAVPIATLLTKPVAMLVLD